MAHPLKGKKQSKEHIRKRAISNSIAHKKRGTIPPSRKGCIPWNKGKKGLSGEMSPSWKGGKPLCKVCGKKLSRRQTATQCKTLLCVKCFEKQRDISGGKNWNWKGGVSKINKSHRQWIWHTKEYKLWRRSVFERDNYRCIFCGVDKEKAVLHADHIKPWCNYPELRFAIDNGRTLCVECHKKTDTWGYKAINK
jgi:5-methylcytosine-specific restriction endonuclease McrA